MVVGAISAYTSNNIEIETLVIALCFFSASTNLWILCGSLLNMIITTGRNCVLFNRIMGVLIVLSILPMINVAL